MLAVGDGNLVYWEACGHPLGEPAVVFHGGPGSGCSDWHRRLFDPAAWRFDFQAPVANAWELSRVWPQAERVLVDDAGHAAGDAIREELVRGTDGFASTGP